MPVSGIAAKVTYMSYLRRGQENIKRLRIEIADARTIFWQLRGDNL